MAYEPLAVRMEIARRPGSGKVRLSWIGGANAYQVQMRKGMKASWKTVIETSEQTVELAAPETGVVFYRVVN